MRQKKIPTALIALKKHVESRRVQVGKMRDALRGDVDELQSFVESLDEAYDALDDARRALEDAGDAMSKYA